MSHSKLYRRGMHNSIQFILSNEQSLEERAHCLRGAFKWSQHYLGAEFWHHEYTRLLHDKPLSEKGQAALLDIYANYPWKKF